MGRPATDKKDRLVDSAMVRFHRSGVAYSSLVSVAADAGVPPGNVFYYFRSKGALYEAVIDRWTTRVDAHLAQFESLDDPVKRVIEFLRRAGSRQQEYADFGCPLAALDRDLRQTSPELLPGRPLAAIRSWFDRQFGLVVDDETRASGFADFCFASLQGSYSLAHAAGDAGVVGRTVEQLVRWIEQEVRR